MTALISIYMHCFMDNIFKTKYSQNKVCHTKHKFSLYGSSTKNTILTIVYTLIYWLLTSD
jgi:hypothetical protein